MVVSEYIASVIFTVRMIVLLANILFFYLIFYHRSRKDVMVSSRRVALVRWLVAKPVLCLAILPIWWYSPLLACLFVPSTYQTELLNEILASVTLISFPLAPLLLGFESANYCWEKKRQAESTMSDKGPNEQQGGPKFIHNR